MRMSAGLVLASAMLIAGPPVIVYADEPTTQSIDSRSTMARVNQRPLSNRGLLAVSELIAREKRQGTSREARPAARAAMRGRSG